MRFTSCQNIEEHPDAAFSRFMTTHRGPGTDVPSMTRLDRFKSALTFFLWAILSFAMLALSAFLVWGLEILPPDNVVFLALVFGLTFWTLVCLAAGLCLLVRAII